MVAEAKPGGATSRRSHMRLSEFFARYGIVFVLALMVIGLTIITPLAREGRQLFLTEANLRSVAQQAVINAVLAAGLTFVITSGGIDLSVGSIVALSGVLCAMAMRDLGIGPVGGFVAAMLVGLLCGIFNGLIITRVGLPPFIVTLGTLLIFRGLALVISEGLPIYGFGREFLRFFGDPWVQIGIAALVAVIAWALLNHTRFGKYTTAIGGNEEAARLAGIGVNRVKVTIYGLSGMLAGVAAALLVARLSSGDPTYANGAELNAIAAVIMGGTSLNGGEGTMTGTIVGALIISLIYNGMNILNVSGNYQNLVIGTVIVLAVTLDQWRKRQGRRL